MARSRLSREPVAIASAVRLTLVAGAALGLGLDGEQIVAVTAAVEAWSLLVVRCRVFPLPSRRRRRRRVAVTPSA